MEQGMAARAISSVIVMGVSGCGKSTVGEALANALNVEFVDGDDLHPEANIKKMSSGQALNDDDRAPWLKRIHELISDNKANGKQIVVVCSALKLAYRNILRGGAISSSLHFVHLSGSYELILERMQARKGHFMKADMLKSQFDTLEVPGSDESDVITVSITASVEDIINQVVSEIPQQIEG